MRLRGKTGILAMAVVLNSAAYAQAPAAPEISAPNGAPTQEIGGSATIDVITLKENSLGIPLRHGGVLNNSERVEFNGKTLKRGEDYQIDYEAGVVYLMRATKAGEVVRVGYRWDASKVAQKKVASAFAGVTPFTFDVAPGSRLLVGFGMTERGADGNIVQSSVYGWNNTFKFGAASTNGLLLVGDRQKVQSESNYEYQNQSGATEEGKSHFYMQNMALAVGGGSIEVNYQDISKNFAGFNAAADQMDAGKLAQLKKERGLQRFGFGLNGVNVGGMKVSGAQRSVDDESGEISWQNVGLETGGFKLNWSQREVDETFKRFQDIAEQDREQLRKESGMSRETLGAEFAQKALKMSFNMKTVSDPGNAEIERRELNLQTTNFKFSYWDTKVDKDFRRMASLLDQEKAQYGREVGMQRQFVDLQTSLFGLASSIKFTATELKNSEGDGYTAENWSVGGKGWSLESAVRAADPGFNNFNSMQDAERNENINSIGRMYDPNGVPFRGEEVQWFARSQGISRNLTRFQANPFKNWNLRFDSLKIQGQEDEATVDTLILENKQAKLQYRREDLGDKFNELGRLMEMERWRLGTISGLERTDLSFAYQFSPSRSFLYSSMSADAPNGSASRNQFAYNDPKLAVAVTTRNVDTGFTNVNQLVDPEKDFLATLRGFTERDVKAAWNIASNMKFDLYMLDSASATLDQTNYIHSGTLNWRPDKNTSIVASRFEQRSDDPLNVLFASVIDTVNVTRSFGSLGILRYSSETRDYDGTQANLSDLERKFYGYETKLNTKTTLKSEASFARWDDGKKEDVQTNTVSTELSKRVGVSVSDTKIDRDGETRDEKKRGYGFWYDFGNGMRLIYGFAQHRAGEQALDTNNQNAQLTGGNVGNLAIGNGGYQQNQWEGDRTQAMGGIGISTIKPMQFLGFTDLKINASMDTAADRQIWLKENQLFGISGKIAGNALGFDYRSQIAPNGFRGIDRSVFFTTDQKETKPFRLNLKYKERNLPWGDTVIVRDYSLAFKPMKGVELSHNLLTHPEVARGDVILGSITTARRVNSWKLDVNANADTVIGGKWEEMIDQGKPMTRIGGLNVTLFKRSGSPLQLYYGVEQSDPATGRLAQSRYHLRFDQRPGPNQTFSLFVGNISYQQGMQTTQKRNNLTVQLDYQIRF